MKVKNNTFIIMDLHVVSKSAGIWPIPESSEVGNNVTCLYALCRQNVFSLPAICIHPTLVALEAQRFHFLLISICRRKISCRGVGKGGGGWGVVEDPPFLAGNFIYKYNFISFISVREGIKRISAFLIPFKTTSHLKNPFLYYGHSIKKYIYKKRLVCIFYYFCLFVYCPIPYKTEIPFSHTKMLILLV